MILGTAAYMSPEQARGLAVDKRTDVWAFGCVLFEMVSGHSAFVGHTVSDVMASVLRQEPNWTALPDATPVALTRLLHRCLEKTPRRRLHDIADARIGDRRCARKPVGAGRCRLSVNRSARRRDRWPASRPARWSWLWPRQPSCRSLCNVGLALMPRRPSRRIVTIDQRPGRRVRSGHLARWQVGGVIYPMRAAPSDVWVKFLAGSDSVNLTAATNLDITNVSGISGLDISPDGTRIAVMARIRGTSSPSTPGRFLRRCHPGVPRKLLVDRLGMRWSPDGRQIAFIRAGGSAGDALSVADADGTNARDRSGPRGSAHPLAGPVARRLRPTSSITEGRC